MNARKKSLLALTVLPLLSVGIAYGLAGGAPESAHAASPYGITRDQVCGDRLCSEYPGGRKAFEASMREAAAERAASVGGGGGDDGADERIAAAMAAAADARDADEDGAGDEDAAADGAAEGTAGEEAGGDAAEPGDGAMSDKKDRDKMADKKDRDKMADKKKKYGKDWTPTLRLSRANVPAVIPMSTGYYEGGTVYYITTDSSDPTHASIISDLRGWNVELSPVLADAPDEAVATAYMFTNGVEGPGMHGFQGEVFTATPEQADEYSALAGHIHVTWNDGSEPRTLTSEAEILEAEADGDVVLTGLPVILNMPHIVWPGGQMDVKENATLSDDTPYGGGQVIDIDTDAMTATFVAHRGWGPDGRTSYYIVTDATPEGPAGMMGVVSSPTSASLIASPAAVDLYQFANGIAGTGPLGFQPGIATAALGDETYSPMWRIYLVTWNDPADAALLETKADIDAMVEDGLVSVSLARPMDSDHIVNCPFINPFQ